LGLSQLHEFNLFLSFCLSPFTLYQKPVIDHCPWPSSQFNNWHAQNKLLSSSLIVIGCSPWFIPPEFKPKLLKEGMATPNKGSAMATPSKASTSLEGKNSGFWRKIQKMHFPRKWLNRKTKGTIRKCSSRAFQ
jgi:hypothetical protein